MVTPRYTYASLTTGLAPRKSRRLSPAARSGHGHTLTWLHRLQGGVCFYCGHSVLRAEASLDHFVSRARGGINAIQNKVMACLKCNNEKGDTPPEAFFEQLGRPFRLPPLVIPATAGEG